MIDLSKCKFGDKLKTRGGRMVLFLGIQPPSEGISCIIEDRHLGFLHMWYNNNGTSYDSVYGERYDIVGKWEDNV